MEKDVNKVVLHILSSNIFSGAENVVCQIIKMFQSHSEYRMVYCSLDGPIREKLEQEGIEFVPIAKKSVGEIRRVIAQVKPTLIHAHDMRASFLTSLACGTIPFVCHIHNNGFDSRKLNLKVFLFDYASKRAKHIFWVSEAAKEGYYYKEKISQKSSVLYNVVDRQEIIRKAKLTESENQYDVIYLGRLSFEKNPLRFIDLLSELVKKVPTIKAAIVGTGLLEEEVRQKIVEYGLDEVIDMLGFQTNPYPILKNSKILVLTSLWEGLPMCALEALSLGIPIVSTPTDGLCELVLEGKTGYLSDENSKLADRIYQLINDENLYREFSVNSLERSKELLDLEQFKNVLSAYYE